MSFESLLKQKNKRLEDIPLELQTLVEKQQGKVLNGILDQLNSLETVNGKIKINNSNLNSIVKISNELKSIMLNDEYVKAVKEFVSEFDVQANLNNKIIDAGFGDTADPVAAKTYIDLAKKNTYSSLVGSAAELAYIQPIQTILEQAIINGASVGETIDNITIFVKGNSEVDSKILKYAKTITNDAFAISDRSYTSIISDYLDSEWFYYSGSLLL